MIIYSETKGNFIQSCKADKNGDTIEKEVTQMMLLNGIKFFDEAQKRAWRNSLPAVAQALKKTHISDECIVAVEYTVRQARERLDFVITGKDSKDHRNMIIVELKQWSGVSVSAMDYHVLANVAHGIMQEHWHPSYQARNYGNIISNTYEVIQSHNIGIYSCSFLHNMPKQFGSLIKDQVRFPLLAESPCFLKEDVDAFAAFLGKYVESADTGLLAEIDSSKIVTSKQLSDMILDALHGNPFFSYDKGQAAAVEKIKSVVNDCLEFDERRTIIIKGGPGTGKSVVALNVLGQLTKPEKGKKTGHNVIYCTVNAAPRTVYKQELVQGDFTKAQIKEFFKYPSVFKNIGTNEIDCALFDEAHRLFINKGGIGVPKGTNLLRKAIQGTRVSVFFIDEDQMVTKDDYTTIERIRKISEELHKRVIESIDGHTKLELTSQFRVAGGEKYMSFIKSFLGYNDDEPEYKSDLNYEFKVFDSAAEMHRAIRERDMAERQKKSQESSKSISTISGCCRVVAGYCYEWKSRKHFRGEDIYDIILDQGEYKAKWNLDCGQSDYSWLMDPLSVDEVGCIHTCQGLDLKYCGVIIGKDMVYRNGHIMFDKTKNAKSDKSSGIRNASDELAEKLIRNTYHVLLTRGMLGTFVYCEDEELREYLKSLMK